MFLTLGFSKRSVRQFFFKLLAMAASFFLQGGGRFRHFHAASDAKVESGPQGFMFGLSVTA
eukprot:5518604-Amphidinium_carterae.1